MSHRDRTVNGRSNPLGFARFSFLEAHTLWGLVVMVDWSGVLAWILPACGGRSAETGLVLRGSLPQVVSLASHIEGSVVRGLQGSWGIW